MLEDLSGIFARWLPELVIHDATEMAGAIAAEAAGIPHVEHSFGILRPEVERGLATEAVAAICSGLGVRNPGVGGIEPRRTPRHVTLLAERSRALGLAAAGGPDLAGVVVGMLRIDLKPTVNAVRPGVHMRSGALPLIRTQRLEKLEARLADRAEDRQGGLDWPIVMQPPGPLRLVIACDDWLVLGEKATEANVGGRLAVGEMVNDLARRPTTRPLWPIEFRGLDIGQSRDDIVVAGPESSEALGAIVGVHHANLRRCR
jgi:hypothetical protein